MHLAKLLALSTLCLMTATSCSSQATPPASTTTANTITNTTTNTDRIATFWTWFNANESALAEMQPADPKVFELGDKLKAINEGLAFEVGPAPEPKKQLAISADGDAKLFPIVEEIVAAAPKLKAWEIVAFKQRTPPEVLKRLRISARPAQDGKVVEGAAAVTVAVSDMRVSAKKSGDNAAVVVVYIKDYKGPGPQDNMAITMLQQALGEYDLATKIEDLSFKPLSAAPKQAKPFEELGPLVDEMLPSKPKTSAP